MTKILRDELKLLNAKSEQYRKIILEQEEVTEDIMKKWNSVQEEKKKILQQLYPQDTGRTYPYF